MAQNTYHGIIITGVLKGVSAKSLFFRQGTYGLILSTVNFCKVIQRLKYYYTYICGTLV